MTSWHPGAANGLIGAWHLVQRRVRVGSPSISLKGSAMQSSHRSSVRRRAFVLGVLPVTLAAVLVPLTGSPASAAAGSGSVSLTGLGTPVVEQFDALANTGTSNTTLPVGWFLEENGSSAANNDAYAAGTGSSATGDTYSFGTSGSTERAFGTLLSGTLTPTIGASFTNNTGSQVTALDIDYAGEQWRLGALGSAGTPPRGPDRLDFQYSVDATSLTTGTWTDVDDLDFTSPVTGPTVGLLDGNAAANRTSILAMIPGLAIGPGATFWIRWSDFNVSSSDDGLAVDEFSLTPLAIDAAPSVSATSPAAGAVSVAPASDVSITFSEPVDVTDPWFSIACGSTGTHTATVTGGPTTFTLDPAADFGSNETCTVTVLASQVTDQDTDDPPNAMAGDAAFSFTTADVSVCGDPATYIHAIQGDGPTAAQTGVRTIEGVVVGDYQGTGQFGGYYVQEEDSDIDANPLTSEGIFVFNTSFPVAVGDTVRVRGTAGEFNGQTQISAVQSTLTCPPAGASVSPASVTFPVAAVSDLERYEGMSISVAQDLTVTEVFTLARFGEVSLSANGRLDTPTNEVAPGAPALALQDLNDRSRILLDDGNNQQNIDPTFYPDGGLSATNTLRVGDSLPSLTGVLDFRFGVYRVQPVDADAITFTQANPRPVAPEAIGGDLQVAAFNVLNYFNGDGAGGGFPTERGATTLNEFNRQRAKIISAITQLDAEVVGLMELENDRPPLSAIEDLVAGLNAATAPGMYDFIDTGIVGTDAIRVGIIYQPAVVTPVGSHAIINSTVDPRFIDTLNRPSIAQTFELNASGERFTTVVNHLKSKGSDCNAVGDPDIGDGQGNCNGTRTAAAEALVDWLATDPTASGDPDVVVLGDMNAYAMEDPITAFKDAGYVDTIADFVGDEGYSFVFDGQSGYLDHALASPSLAAQVSGVTEWHINADEPVALDYNVEFKTPNQVTTFYDPGPYRSSDHDPALVGLDLNSAPMVDAGGPYTVAEGSTVTVTATGSDPDNDALTYAWDLDDNGTFETAGQSATFSAAGIEAPASRTIAVQVTDTDGFTATDTATVNVVWDFSGFFPPIVNLPGLNSVKPGSSVAVKFSLGGNQGLAIFAAGSPTSTPIDCVTRTALGPAQQIAFAGRSMVTYTASTDTYTVSWKTAKNWTGCRRLSVTLADGTVHEADFRFVR